MNSPWTPASAPHSADLEPFGDSRLAPDHLPLHGGRGYSYWWATSQWPPGTMKQEEKRKALPAKSREGIEAECLKLARQVRGAAGIQRVIVRRLPGAPNWKVADVLPQPDLALVGEVRAALADLPKAYAFADE
jgi:hypothetical protein